MIWELLLVVMPPDGSTPMTATGDFATKTECESKLKSMVEMARTTLGSDFRIESSCKEKAGTATSPSAQPESRPSHSIPKITGPKLNLSCTGYFALMKTNVSFVFYIDPPSESFTGSQDAIHELAGTVGGTPSVYALMFKQANMNAVAWIDRNTGGFKVDLSNDSLYLKDNIVGQCEKFSGRKF